MLRFRESLGDTLTNSVSINSNNNNNNLNFSLRSITTNNILNSIDSDSIEVSTILEKYSDKLLELVSDKIIQKMNKNNNL